MTRHSAPVAPAALEVGETPAHAPWRMVELLAVPAGWAVALALLGPDVLSAGAGERGAPLLVMVGALLWWIAAVAIVRSDLRDFIIPDGASLAILLLGLAVAVGVPWLSGDGRAAAASAVAQALSSGAVAFAIFRLVGLAFRRFGRDALGFGDVKLAGACAVWLTPGDAAVALEVAALGAIAMLLLGRSHAGLRDTAVPFGAFLAPAAWLVFVLAPSLRSAAALVPW